ncbi:MAG: hypothetical protein A4E38_01618 [Methanoregulaceae archaeon PtaB.Bin108]|nr:MAG: hypothetical protein A4E38_01618 [Methanoregulaceae archaeon PtaB.Bin108]
MIRWSVRAMGADTISGSDPTLSLCGSGRPQNRSAILGLALIRKGEIAIVQTATVRKTCVVNSERNANSCPARMSTNENSPMFERAIPARTEVRRDWWRASEENPAMTDLRRIAPAINPRIRRGLFIRMCAFRSIPMEMKKKLVKISRNGRMVANAWWK